MVTTLRPLGLSCLLALTTSLACGDDQNAQTAQTEGDSSSGGTSQPPPGTGSSGTGSETATETTTNASTTIEDTTGSTTTSSTDTNAASSSSSSGEPVIPPSPLLWTEECTVGATNIGVLHPRLECTGVDVPLDWDDPEGEQIQIAAFRVRTEAAQRQGTVWLLDGGPGGSGLGFVANPGTTALYNDAGWDVVVPSHRGTVSPRLRCLSPTYSTQCREELDAEWGTGLRHFNTVNAAHDVGALIDRAGVDERGNTIVYGVSYGSFWAHHYLGLHPTGADGVVLDSVLRAGVNVAGQLLLDHQRAEDLLERCVTDPACGPSLPYVSGTTFGANLVETWDAFDCGAIDTGLWRESPIRSQLGSLVNNPTTRNYFPFLAALLAQCDPDATQLAQSSINAIFANVTANSLVPVLPRPLTWGVPPMVPAPFGLPADLFYSDVVFGVVAGTSVIPEGADANAAVAASGGYLVTIGLGELVATASNTFGDLPNPPFSANFAAQTPTLILNARYDLQTPLAWSAQAADRLGVDLHIFEDGAHSLASPGNGGKAPGGTPCATAMILAFADDPEQPVDASCIEGLRGIDVSLARPDLQATSLAVFGTTNPWLLLP